MSCRWAPALAFLLLLMTEAPDALAFCRTTTVKSAADYDSTVDGCWTKGVPLFWRNACVGYSIQKDGSRKISYDDISNAMSTAFTRWTGATCPTLGDGRARTSIDVRDLGPVECANVEYKSRVANQNVILFRDDSWKYGSSVLGLTTVVYSPDTGEIYGADMEINTFQMDPLAVHDPVDPNAYDFLSVVTHEAGHFLGIAHSDVPGATMFARYSVGQTSLRNLSADDILAVCSVYRPDGERAVLKDKVFKSPQCDPTPRGGYSSVCQETPSAVSCAGSTSPSRPVKGLAIGASALVAVAILRRRHRRRKSTR